jgi:hypothetical protein
MKKVKVLHKLLIIIICISYISLISCVVSKPLYIDTVCLLIKPIMISKNDKLTDDTLRQIYELNILLKEKCVNS